MYIYIYTIYRHMFCCSTAHQCSLVQSGYGMPTIYTQAIVSDNRCGTIAVMRTSRERKAIWGQSAQTTTRVVGFALLLKDT